MSSGCASTATASRGWSTSSSPRADDEGPGRFPRARAPRPWIDAGGLAVLLVDVDVAVDLDPLLADVGRDGLLRLHRVLPEPDPLDRNGFGGHDGSLLAEDDLVLLLGQRRAVHRLADVAVGDRLTLDPDLLAGHRDGHLLLLADDVLSQPRAACLDPLGRGPHALLRAGHRVVSRRPGRVSTLVGRASPRSGGVAGLTERRPLPQPVMPVQGRLLGLAQVAGIGVHGWRVLDLVLAVGNLEVAVTGDLGAGQRHEALPRAEEPGLHGHPLRGRGLVVQEHLADLADALLAGVDHLATDELLGVELLIHRVLLVRG